MQAAGWFGKLSFLGDFASRRLPETWLHTCDRWLSECMTGAAQQLGSGFLPAYLHAPVWRFACGRGVMDDHWWFGVLMASCDNVGRYFPLVVAQARERAPEDRFALDHLELWWAHAARAALDSLGERATLEAFEAALHDAPPWPAARGAARCTDEAAVALRAIEPSAALTDLVHGLAASALQQRLRGRSLWWPLHADGSGGAYLLVDRLPTPATFATMLAAS